MHTAANDWSLTLKNLFFPIFCKQCGVRLLTEDNGYFCPNCWESSPKIERPFCPVCGRPHPAGVGLNATGNFRCGPCSVSEKPYPYRRVLGAARYDGAVKLAIKLMKFYDKPRLARPLGELLRDQAARELDVDAYTHVIPVPLHRVRRRERGFNQAELLAEAVLQLFPRAQLDHSLIRVRPTHVQSRLHAESDRHASVRGAFTAIHVDHLHGASVLLVDDVVTTGATVGECANALLQCGVASVDVLAVALALPHEDRFEEAVDLVQWS